MGTFITTGTLVVLRLSEEGVGSSNQIEMRKGSDKRGLACTDCCIATGGLTDRLSNISDAPYYDARKRVTRERKLYEMEGGASGRAVGAPGRGCARTLHDLSGLRRNLPH